MDTDDHALAETGDGPVDIDDFMSGCRELRHRRLSVRNKAALGRFLGRGRRVQQTGIVPRYYGELLTWALARYMEGEGWQVRQALGYVRSEPVYIDVNTACGERENLLMNGQMLAARGDGRLIVTVEVNPQGMNSVLVEGPAARQEEVRANTVGFLSRRESHAARGIPPRRGLLLAGDPGTGKTIICKALMAEADGLTCIAANAYALGEDGYLGELYDLAADLAPCIVFIEDIDLIGQNRDEFGYQKRPALMSLLSVLDGIEEKKDIVTVATTNCPEILDRALSQRPSRFDRVVRLARPGF